MTKHLYHLANIRQLLLRGFNERELRRLCFDIPDFRPVYDELSPGASKADIVDAVLEFAEIHLRIDTLLALAKAHNPARYEEHGPYHLRETGKSISPLSVPEGGPYYSCFISYASQDEAFAQQLYTDLRNNGVRCWYAPEDMKIGDKRRTRIDKSIREQDKLLLILSANSINSTWVEKEVETAFEEEDRHNRIILFPIRLDATVMETDEAWAADIRRTRHIGDFSRWKDYDAYRQALERLLRDLKAES